MLTKNKKFIIFILIVIVLVAIVFLIYYFWSKSKKTPIEEKTITKITEEKAKGINYIEKENKIRFLSLNSFTFKELDLKTNKLSNLNYIPMYLVQDIIWSPNSKRIILKVKNNRAILSQQGYLLDKNAPDDTITTWSFDLENQSLLELPREIGGVEWLNDERIIYYYSKSFVNIDISKELSGSSLNESNFEGKDYKKIIDLDNNKFFGSQVHLSPDKSQAILFPETEGVGNNYSYIIDLKTKAIKNITEDKLTAAASWSTSGKNIFLYQIIKGENETNQKFDVWFANKEGVNKKKIDSKSLYGLVITNKDDSYIYIASFDKDNNQIIYQINSGSLDKKIIIDSTKEKDLVNITEIGLLQNNIYAVANDYLYLIKI
ncbi:MAG: hypothetical protein NT039_02605 [Candidatus Berkelbacteria bacterium]|nr:hypothetical protein [Candidatus Berkelbacteria bacterium]